MEYNYIPSLLKLTSSFHLSAILILHIQFLLVIKLFICSSYYIGHLNLNLTYKIKNSTSKDFLDNIIHLNVISYHFLYQFFHYQMYIPSNLSCLSITINNIPPSSFILSRKYFLRTILKCIQLTHLLH